MAEAAAPLLTELSNFNLRMREIGNTFGNSGGDNSGGQQDLFDGKSNLLTADKLNFGLTAARKLLESTQNNVIALFLTLCVIFNVGLLCHF